MSLDQAIVEAADQKDNLSKLNQGFKKISEIPFDFKRRRLSIVGQAQNKNYLITKGAAEEMLSCAGYVEINGQVKKLPKFMFILGPTSSIFDILTFGILYFWICPQVVGSSYAAAAPAQKAVFAAVFCTGWFIESLWTQEMVIQVLRAPGLPFIDQHASKMVIFSTLGVAAVGTILPYTIIGQDLNFIHIPLYYIAVVAVILLLYVLLTSLVKKVYLKTETNLI